jgi:hypothetical protein
MPPNRERFEKNREVLDQSIGDDRGKSKLCRVATTSPMSRDAEQFLLLVPVYWDALAQQLG